MTADQIKQAWLDANGFDDFWDSNLDGRIVGVCNQFLDRPTHTERLCMAFQITGEI